MRIKKVPCLAWITRAHHPENVNRVVEVVGRAEDDDGHPAWWVTSSEKMPAVDANTGLPMKELHNKIRARDSQLTPINDPGLDVSDTDIVAPVMEKQWEFPKEKENV